MDYNNAVRTTGCGQNSCDDRLPPKRDDHRFYRLERRQTAALSLETLEN
jgi:hypothetical protein